MKTRLQSLGLLDRALRATTDEELDTAVAALGDDHREAVERLAGGEATADGASARRRPRVASTGRWRASPSCSRTPRSPTASSSSATTPTTRRAISCAPCCPGIIERHGLGVTRLMLASTLAGEAAASAVIRDLLKHDDTIKLPPVDDDASGPAARPPDTADADVKARRLEVKRRKQAEARARREQSARARNRA